VRSGERRKPGGHSRSPRRFHLISLCNFPAKLFLPPQIATAILVDHARARVSYVTLYVSRVRPFATYIQPATMLPKNTERARYVDIYRRPTTNIARCALPGEYPYNAERRISRELRGRYVAIWIL
jgi:hypothetical protein